MTIFFCKHKDCNVRHSISAHPQEKKFELHAHAHCEMLYFISGDGYYTVEGRDYPLTCGCVLLMRDGEIHKIHINSDRPYERIVISFPLENVLGQEETFAPLRSMILDRQPGCGNLFVPPKKENASFLEACFSRICRSAQASKEFGMQLTTTLPAILSELYAIRTGDACEDKPKQQGNVILTDIIDYINQNLTTIGSLSELEKRFFFSKSTLNRMFLESTGSTVWDYVIIKRLHAARRMLMEGGRAASAAMTCGFGDYSSFYRQYRRFFGESPCRERTSKKKADDA